MLLPLLLTAWLARQPAPAGCIPPPACPYSAWPAATRRLLQRLDQALPRVVTRLQQATPSRRMPYVEVDSCFRRVVLDGCFTAAAEIPMRQGLRGFYAKELGDPTLQPAHAARLLVLAYTNVEAATHAEHLQDSLYRALQQRCRGRIKELEPCVGLDSHRFTRVGAHLLHYAFYSQDPDWRVSLQDVAGALTAQVADTATPASQHVPAVAPRPRPARRSGPRRANLSGKSAVRTRPD